MLIILGGLPGVGKTTLARALAKTYGATHLRIDTIEQALRDSQTLAGPVGPAGYLVAYALAADQLRLGHTVVADSVNSIAVTRQAWIDTAQRTGSRYIEVEVICSDHALHRARVETRETDIPGLALPDWQKITKRQYDAWQPHIVVDTAFKAPEVSIAELMSKLAALLT